MISDIEIRGKWFLPSKSRRKISGILKYTASAGANLELDDFLLAEIEEAFSIIEPEVILGISSSEEHVTLYRCAGAGSSFHVYQFFVGAHFKNPERIKFQHLTLDYLHLHEWVDPQNLESKSTTDPEGFTVTYKDSQPILLAETKEYTIHVGFGVFLSRGIQKGVTIRSTINILVYFLKATHLDRCLQISQLIQNLISLAMLHASQIESFKGTTKIRGKDTTVTIIAQPINDEINRDVIKRPDMLFNLSDMGEYTNYFINNWISKFDLLESIHNLYFGTMYSPFMYTEHRFLNYAQAIETYHRRVIGGGYQEKEIYLQGVYQQLIKCLPKDLDNEFRESIKTGLKYTYQYSLRKRLRELIKSYQTCLPENLITQDNDHIKTFVDKVVSTRNYLTHHDDKGNAAEGVDIYYLSLWLKMLIEVSLLKEIGFNDSDIKIFLSRSRNYQLIKPMGNY